MYNIRLKWLTITCFELQFGDTTVVTDPCIGASPFNGLTWEDIERCDIITLSHCHWDHITDIPVLMRKFPVPLLTGSLSAMPMLQWVDCDPTRVYPMDVNLELDFGGVKIKALFGRHCSPGKTAKQLPAYFAQNPNCAADPAMLQMQVLGSLEYRNFLFTTKDGVKVLLWGNEVIESQKNMLRELRPDICILQLSKQTPEEVAELAAVSGCKVLIPHHMDLSKTREQYLPRVEQLREEFLKRVPDGLFICPENNRWIDL